MEQHPRVVDFDGCTFNLKTRNGIHIKKPWRIITDHSGFDDSPRRFGSGGRPRAEARGKGAKRSENYTTKLVTVLAEQLRRPNRRPVREAHPTSTTRKARRRTPPATAAAQDPALTAAEERTLRSAIMQLHMNTGHPSNGSLARAIRVTGGGSQRSIEMAQPLLRGACSTSATTTSPTRADQTGQGLRRPHRSGPVHPGRLRWQPAGLPQRGRPGLRFYGVRHCRIKASI
eukprot:7293419-Pyramimonas_sp.AAC.1